MEHNLWIKNTNWTQLLKYNTSSYNIAWSTVASPSLATTVLFCSLTERSEILVLLLLLPRLVGGFFFGSPSTTPTVIFCSFYWKIWTPLLLLPMWLAMGANKYSEISSYRKKWDKIFNGLVHMLQTQQAQIETLAKERKLLEDRIRVQHERWTSDVNLYEDRLSQVVPQF